MKLKPVKEDKKQKEPQNLAEQVVIGAAGLAIISGAVALGASLFTNEKTREKLGKSFKQFMASAKETLETIEETRSKLGSKL